MFQAYSKESKHRSDSLDEASQFSDLDDQLGASPAHKPTLEKTVEENIITEGTSLITKETTSKIQTLEFLKFESEYSAQIHAPALTTGGQEKVTQYFI